MVYAPKEFNEVQIAEMPANSDKAALGRNLKIALSSLTNNPSHAYTEVVLKVTDVNGEAAHTQILRLELLYSYIRSLVRRYKSIADCVFNSRTKDERSVTTKLLVVTRGRSAHTKLVGIRKEAIMYVNDYISGKSFQEAVSSIVEGKLQQELATKLSKIVPISRVEIKKFEVNS